MDPDSSVLSMVNIGQLSRKCSVSSLSAPHLHFGESVLPDLYLWSFRPEQLSRICVWSTLLCLDPMLRYGLELVFVGSCISRLNILKFVSQRKALGSWFHSFVVVGMNALAYDAVWAFGIVSWLHWVLRRTLSVSDCLEFGMMSLMNSGVDWSNMIL